MPSGLWYFVKTARAQKSPTSFFHLGKSLLSEPLLPFNRNGFICKATILKLRTNLSSASNLVVEVCGAHVKPGVVLNTALGSHSRKGTEREEMRGNPSE